MFLQRLPVELAPATLRTEDQVELTLSREGLFRLLLLDRSLFLGKDTLFLPERLWLHLDWLWLLWRRWGLLLLWSVLLYEYSFRVGYLGRVNCCFSLLGGRVVVEHQLHRLPIFLREAQFVERRWGFGFVIGMGLGCRVYFAGLLPVFSMELPRSILPLSNRKDVRVLVKLVVGS